MKAETFDLEDFSSQKIRDGNPSLGLLPAFTWLLHPFRNEDAFRKGGSFGSSRSAPKLPQPLRGGGLGNVDALLQPSIDPTTGSVVEEGSQPGRRHPGIDIEESFGGTGLFRGGFLGNIGPRSFGSL